MADAELHIIVKNAGDPEKLGALLNAAIEMKTGSAPVRVVIPTGYRCVECYRDDGRHETTCSCWTMEQVRESVGNGQAQAEHNPNDPTTGAVQQGG
jgi:hypothetical protein